MPNFMTLRNTGIPCMATPKTQFEPDGTPAASTVARLLYTLQTSISTPLPPTGTDAWTTALSKTTRILRHYCTEVTTTEQETDAGPVGATYTEITGTGLSATENAVDAPDVVITVECIPDEFSNAGLRVTAERGDHTYYHGQINNFDAVAATQRGLLASIAVQSATTDVSVTKLFDYYGANAGFDADIPTKSGIDAWSELRDRHYETIRGNVRDAEQALDTTAIEVTLNDTLR